MANLPQSLIHRVLRKPLAFLSTALPPPHCENSLALACQGSVLHLASFSSSLHLANFCCTAQVPRNYTRRQGLDRIRKVPEILPPSLIHGGCQESFANGINLNVVDENHLNESGQDKQESWSFPPPWGCSGFPGFCFFASTFPSRGRHVPSWKPVQVMLMSPDLTNPAFPPLPPVCLCQLFHCYWALLLCLILLDGSKHLIIMWSLPFPRI